MYAAGLQHMKGVFPFKATEVVGSWPADQLGGGPLNPRMVKAPGGGDHNIMAS